MDQPNPETPRIAVTAGEPAGIGPDLCVQLAQQAHAVDWVVIANPELLAERARQLNLTVSIQRFDPNQPSRPQTAGSLTVWPVALRQRCSAGQLNVDNAAYVIESLDIAIDACLKRSFAALVTGPVHKGIINQAGLSFSGHTEYLAQRSQAPRPVMMLQTQGLRVALVTTHLPLRKVADAITPAVLQSVIEILHQDLQQKMAIANPRIFVCGLNPHAGEDGHLGREELEVIIPIVEKLRGQGLNLQGPFPADTVFTPDRIKQCDVILAMYHDQGLPVLKHLGFGNAVNITLGLPFIRTSVDHGTALELAGRGGAHASSLLYALQTAMQMATHTKYYGR